MRPNLTWAVLVVLWSFSAAAQNRTFVSINGSDMNACTTAAPCRSFATAVNAAASGGEVIVLDSGGYGPVTINKAVSIIAPKGVYAGVTVTSGTGITDNHGDGVVVLRGLTITGLGGTDGIEMIYAQNLHLEDVQITSFRNGSAVLMWSSYNTHEPQLVIRDSILREVSYGVNLLATGFGQAVSVDHVRFDMAYGAGIQLADNSLAYVSNCVFLDGNYGLYLRPVSGVAQAVIDGSMFEEIDRGVTLFSTGTGASYARVGRSTFVNQTQAASRGGPGSLVSFGNNQIDDSVYAPAFDVVVPTQ